MPRSSSLLSRSLARHLFSGRQERERRSLPIIVHSHLSWDNVWQRPQQYLSRLAQWHPVLFVETEVREMNEDAHYEYRAARGANNVTQIKIIFPSSVWGDGAYVDRQRRRLLKTALLTKALRGFARGPIQWFYDPMAVNAFLGQMDEALVIYDCMDELSQFRGASSEIVLRERELLKEADLVFCGGKKLHEAKRIHHHDCHFYGCGVDVRHLATARDGSTRIPKDIRDLPRPIFGYYGVVDERLDYDLLRLLARGTPGSVVVIGPTAKVDPSEFPQHPRLHWLGRREYKDLPAYAKGFDACLMPFALNKATEFINPTKALEYLAAGRPVVSTAVSDVVSLFSDVVHIAASYDEFIAYAHQQAENPSRQWQRAGIRRAEANTWERLSAELEGHIVRKVTERVSAAPMPAFSLASEVGSI